MRDKLLQICIWIFLVSHRVQTDFIQDKISQVLIWLSSLLKALSDKETFSTDCFYYFIVSVINYWFTGTRIKLSYLCKNYVSFSKISRLLTSLICNIVVKAVYVMFFFILQRFLALKILLDCRDLYWTQWRAFISKCFCFGRL